MDNSKLENRINSKVQELQQPVETAMYEISHLLACFLICIRV